MNQGWSRREFARRGAAACAALAAARSGDGRAAVSGDSPRVIDTHTHFYDPSRPGGVPWPPKDDAVLYRTVLPETYHRLEQPCRVAGTVVVEASPLVEDNQWILDLAARHPFLVGFVGNLPIGAPECAGLIARFGANPLFRGVRIRGVKLEGLLENPLVVEHLRLLADRELTLDVVGKLECVEFARRALGLVPGLRIVIDHLAGVRVDGGPPPLDWTGALREVARSGRVYCKVSGLVEGTGRRDGSAPRDPGYYRPVLDAVTGIFGVERLLYGSNWPVSEHYAPLGDVQRIALEYFRGRGGGAVERVFVENSRECYRWVTRAG